MGKKGAKRKTRWRALPIGTEEGGSGSGNDEDDLGSYSRATQKPRPQGRTHAGGGGGGGGGGYYNNKQYYHPRPYASHDHSQPLVTTEKQIFNEEEYTKITTPRQDVLFKKGYLGRKRPVVVAPEPEPGHADDNVEDVGDVEGNDGLEDQPQYIYTNGFMDQTGVYYINGSGYEMYDPYTGQVAVLVGPHYGHPGGPPPLLAAVSCQPVPLQPLEWFNPPGFLPYVQAPCHGPGVNVRDRVKRYSTDSQNCSPVSSESTGPPGSPQESDETGRGGHDPSAPATSGAPPQLPLVFPHPPPTYVYPGYMFGAPMFNVNGVTVQTTPNQAPSADVNGKRRKKKRKRRRKANGEIDASEESSSEGGDDNGTTRHDSPSQESSLESDSKLSLSSEEPTYTPAVEGVVALNPRALDFAPPGLNVHVQEFAAKPVDSAAANHSKSNGTCGQSATLRSNANEVSEPTIVEQEAKSNAANEKLQVKAAEKEVNYSKTNGLHVKSHVNGIGPEVNDKYSKTNNKRASKAHKNDDEVAAVELSPRPKLDFASVVSPKANGHATPPPATVAVAVIADTVDDAFECYEDFTRLNGHANGDAEDEWITVKPKTRKSEPSGHADKKEPVHNGHARPFKDNRSVNGRGYKQEARLYKADVKPNGRTDDRIASKPRTNADGWQAKPRLNGKMEGNETWQRGDKERKTSSSSSEGKADAAPVKPARRDRKNKSLSPPATPEVPVVTANERAPCVVDFVVKETRLSPLDAQREPEVIPATLSLVEQIEEKQAALVAGTLPVESALPTILADLPDEPAEQTQSINVAVVNSVSTVNSVSNDETIRPPSEEVAPETPNEAELALPTEDETPPIAKETDVVVVTETKTKDIAQAASQSELSQSLAGHDKQNEPIASNVKSISPVESQETLSEPMATKDTLSEPMASQAAPSEPMASQAAPSEPMASQAAPSEPMASQAAPSEPMASQAVLSEPMASQAAPSEPMASQAVLSEPMASQAAPSEPMASQAAPSEPMASQAALSEPMASQAAPSEPMASQAAPSEPMASQAAPSEPMASQAAPSEPMASQAAPSEPMASQAAPSEPMASQAAPSEPIPSAAPVPPPRRKKYRPPSQRVPERAATPGHGSDSDTSTSLESEASVIECLDSALDRSDQSGLSSSDEEVIYAGKLGVEQPRLVGKMKVPRNTWTSSRTEVASKATPVVCEVTVTPAASTTAPADEVRQIAAEMVAAVIDEAVDEAGKSRRPNLGITDAVTRWLRSQSPDVLSVSSRDEEMADIAEETEDELEDDDDDDDGSKNLQGNPLPAPSVSGSECRQGADAGKRVANKTTDIGGVGDGNGGTLTEGRRRIDSADSEPRDFQDVELEWDSWDLTASLERKAEPAYDPRSNDTYQVVDSRAMETPDLPIEVCPKLYDANLSVAKYYNLAETASPGDQSSDSEAEDLKVAVQSDGYRVSLATELARLQQPLPATWQVAPLVVKSEVEDSGVESGDDLAPVKRPSVFKRRLIGRLKGEGGPFPCGGVCCIVQ